MSDFDSAENKQTLTDLIHQAAREPFVLLNYDHFMKVKLGRLWPEGGNEYFDDKVNNIVEHLGGPPETFIIQDGASPPKVDNYPSAIMREAFDVFDLARNAVLRLDMYHAGYKLVYDNPVLLPFNELSEENRRLSLKYVQTAFWEKAEIAIIRISSFWDRIGQILAFAFFNIRKFEHDGFKSVIDRIKDNIIPMSSELASNASWARIINYQKHAKPDDFGWLVERRNLIIHRLHLHPIDDEEQVFASHYNHFDKAHRDKLRPQNTDDELKLIKSQLNKSASLFDDVLEILKFSAQRKQDPWVLD
ncbi:hypothetical protein [Pantoea agglomerans]|uniref:hypothetical protein n=1 Tax=Enterobacter agglomerans TaxID=549 RepID=UPI003C7B7057